MQKACPLQQQQHQALNPTTSTLALITHPSPPPWLSGRHHKPGPPPSARTPAHAAPAPRGSLARCAQGPSASGRALRQRPSGSACASSSSEQAGRRVWASLLLLVWHCDRDQGGGCEQLKCAGSFVGRRELTAAPPPPRTHNTQNLPSGTAAPHPPPARRGSEGATKCRPARRLATTWRRTRSRGEGEEKEAGE